MREKIGMFFLLVLLATAVSLSGCGEHHLSQQTDLAFDEQAPSGLRVRYFDENSPRIEELEKDYAYVAACMGYAVPPGPLVIFERGILAASGDVSSGYYHFDGRIVIDADLSFNQPGGHFIIKHEFVHHILNMSGFPVDRNSHHDSPFFYACVW